MRNEYHHHDHLIEGVLLMMVLGLIPPHEHLHARMFFAMSVNKRFKYSKTLMFVTMSVNKQVKPVEIDALVPFMKVWRSDSTSRLPKTHV